MADLIAQAARKIKSWRQNPAQFVYEELKAEPDRWQNKVLDVFPSQDPDKIRVAMQACAGPGKSAVLAWCGWNFLSCYGERGEHPKGAAVSMTRENLADNLWPEYSKWQERSPFLKQTFTWTKTRIFANDHPETWFLSARSWSKTANAEEQGRTLSGLHSKYVLVQVDESGSVPLPVAKSGDQALANCKWGKFMQAGNPTDRSSMLGAAATTLRHQWHVIRITGDPDDPDAWVHTPRVGPGPAEWAREQIRTFGRDNPWVMAFILGQFPPSSINTLLGPEEVERAMQRTIAEDVYFWTQKRLGVDVARFGDDRTVIFPRQGLAAFRPVEMRNARTHDIAARVALAKERWTQAGAADLAEFVDDTGGYGAGVIDSMLQAGHSPIPVNAAGKSDDPRYFNKRAECWFRMADWIRRGGCLPNLPDLVRELTTPTYTFHNGKFQLEEKAQLKKRLQFSPDMADALSLTFAHVDIPAAVAIPGLPIRREQRLASDWDPFDENRR